MESSGKLTLKGLQVVWDGTIKPVKGKKTHRILLNMKVNKTNTKVDMVTKMNADETIDILGDVTTKKGKKFTKKHYDLKNVKYQSQDMQMMTPQMIL